MHLMNQAALALTAIAACRADLFAQTGTLPNSYRTVENWARLPDGRTWGSTSAVDVDRVGKSIWVTEPCGVDSCAGSNLPSILKFDPSGKLEKAFGEGRSWTATATYG